MARPKARFPGYDACVKMMMSQDALRAEEGFLLLKEQAGNFVDRLLEDYYKEPRPGLKFWFFELLVESRDPKLMPLFLEMLQDPEELQQHNGVAGLIALGTKEAKRAIWEAGYDPKDNPWNWPVYPRSLPEEPEA